MKSQWKCPYCAATGETVYNKAAFYALSTHLQENHLDIAAQAVIARMDRKAIIDSTAGWRVITPYVKYADAPINAEQARKESQP